MSIMTGVLVWAFATATGLELALEWGVIAFALNPHSPDAHTTG